MNTLDFLPTSLEELRNTDHQYADFVMVTGDAYVDHPSFGSTVIARLLQSLGFVVAILPQPRFDTPEDFTRFRRPKYAFLITAGNIDSMVAHYSVAKKRRREDEYSPGNKTGLRPDRAGTVYSLLAKRAYPDVPVILGGLEASLRRLAHYDYWDNRVYPSILQTSKADLLVYGMGERAITEVANRFSAGKNVCDMKDIPGTCCIISKSEVPKNSILLSDFKKVSSDKVAYMTTAITAQKHTDYLTAKPLVQKQSDIFILQNPPAKPLCGDELDSVYDLPFTRQAHPMYALLGGVKAIEEVRFSIIHNRGCFGGCNFCALTFHQGRRVTARSHESVLREARQIIQMPDFKGYIHDIGGPTANFRGAACKKQHRRGVCENRHCLTPTICPELIVDHSDYAGLLLKVSALPGVKKVFIRSGIRYDYLLADKDETFFRQLVKHHVSGQLKVAPEHSQNTPLRLMNKPKADVFNSFKRQYETLSKKAGKEQYLVPYLMSSHPGCTIEDAKALAVYLKANKLHPEQVQDFYPTPGTLSSAMFYSGLDCSLKEIYVARSSKEKSTQRLLLSKYGRVIYARYSNKN